MGNRKAGDADRAEDSSGCSDPQIKGQSREIERDARSVEYECGQIDQVPHMGVIANSTAHRAPMSFELDKSDAH